MNASVDVNFRSRPLFGQRTRRILPYAASFISISSGAGSAGCYVVSANGIYDPDITGTGGQPMGFDQMMTFFNHYTVLQSRIQCLFKCTSTLTPMVAVALSGSATPMTSIEQIMENGMVGMHWINTNLANATGMVKASVDCAKFQGVRNIMDDPNMRGDAASNPTEQLYYMIYVWNPIDVTVVSSALTFHAEYDVMFHEPRSSSLSLKSLSLSENKGEPGDSTKPEHIVLNPRRSKADIDPAATGYCVLAMMARHTLGFPQPASLVDDLIKTRPDLLDPG